MISNQVIAKTIEDLHSITRIDFSVYDPEGQEIAGTSSEDMMDRETVRLFFTSPADSQEIRGHHFFKVEDDGNTAYVLISKGKGEDVYMMGKVAVASLQALMVAYQEQFNRNTFVQNLLLDNLLLVDIYNKARKLHIDAQVRRLVYIIETGSDKDSAAMEVLKGLFSANSQDFITAVDENSLIYVQEVTDEDPDYQNAKATAAMICDMMDTESIPSVRVAFGTIVDEISFVSQSYKEARMALNVGKIFYTQKRIHAYSALGIGRLIYQLPVNLCEMFMNEIFTQQRPDDFDEETLATINSFFENNLNVSETARQLFVHRNTLVYRLDKLQKSTGLDIRNFEDALTFKIALMVVSYMKYMGNEEV